MLEKDERESYNWMVKHNTVGYIMAIGFFVGMFLWM